LLVARPALAAVPPLVVDARDAACTDAGTGRQHPLCTLQRAAALARTGQTIRVHAGAYAGPLRLSTPGVTLLAERGGRLDAAGDDAALRIVGADDVTVAGLAVSGGRRQGIWVDAASDVTLRDLSISGNQVGLQLKDSRAVTLERSRVCGNRAAGIMELA